MQKTLMQRDIPWIPRFVWKSSTKEAADQINQWHEDYPHRVKDTQRVIEMLLKRYDSFPIPITHELIHEIHREIFSDKDFAGKYRTVNVRVGYHIPPHWEYVEQRMEELLWNSQYIVGLPELYRFYHDLETIHMYADGNGRTGGVLVAVMSHLLSPANGYLSPYQ